MTAGASAEYTGPDRRQPITSAEMPPYLVRTLLGAAVVVGLWSLLIVLAPHRPATARLALVGLSHALTCALLLSAAALRFATWRLTGTARAAWSVVALAVSGLGVPMLWMISRLQPSTTAQAAATSIARGLLDLAFICFGVMVLLTPEVVSRLRPLRIAAPFIAGCLVIAAVTVLRGPSSDPNPSLIVTATVLGWAVAVLWVALAASFVVLGRRRARRTDLLLGIALCLPAAGSLARAALGMHPYQTLVFPAAMQLFVACLIAGGSAIALWSLHTGRGTHLLAVTGELHGARTDLAQLECDEARRLHDARNAILAVSGAVRLLAGRADATSPEDAGTLPVEELERLVTVELDRLGALLDPTFRRANRAFEIRPVIEPLILAHRLAGAQITASVSDARAVGRPDALATAVANILSNARAHAPGAHLWVDAGATDEHVVVRISDDGPGIPAFERSMVLLPGVRGGDQHSPGSGIGLASAAQAMSEQGGTLRLDERPGGGTMITLMLRRDRRQSPTRPAPVHGQRVAAVAAPVRSHPPRVRDEALTSTSSGEK